jgi:hypothetical protein
MVPVGKSGIGRQEKLKEGKQLEKYFRNIRGIL